MEEKSKNEIIRERKKQYYLNNKEEKKQKRAEYYANNIDKVRKVQKQYYEKNKEKIQAYLKEYAQKNKEHIKEKRQVYFREYYKARYTNDPLWKLKLNIRNLIRTSIKNNNYTKKSKTYNILGCSFEEFKEHIEKQFVEGMTWDNHGEWHFDHKKPISLALTEREVHELNHYTNFQPLWAIDNLKKSNKYEHER